MEEIKDRIYTFLQEQQLSSAQLADTIGVQRSSISHILSGRNKPSIDFIEKLINKYPSLDLKWLLSGIKSGFTPVNSIQNKEPELQLNFVNSDISENTDNRLEKEKPSSSDKKTVERIIIFYTDKSFIEYTPD